MFRILMLLLFVPVSLAAQTRALEVDDLFRLRAVGDPEVSPDGEWVAYTVRTTSLEEGSGGTRIWMASMTTGEGIPMTAAGTTAVSPRWSPDGRYLSFTASRNGSRNQVWLLDRRGGEARQLTHVVQGIDSYEWSPDASRLLLTIKDRDAESDSGTPEPWVIDRLQFKRDGAGYLTGHARMHLYVFDVALRTLMPLTWGERDEDQATWSPDGRLVAFVSNRTDDPDANANSDIWVIDVDAALALEVAADSVGTGASLPALALIQVTDNPGTDYAPRWSPDGESFAFITQVEPEIIWYATRHLAVVPVRGGEPRVLTRALDRNVGSPRFSPDGRSIYFEVEESAEDHLARLDVASGRIERIIDGSLSVSGYAMHGGRPVAATINRVDRPGEVHRIRSNGVHDAITSVNDSLIAQLDLAIVHDVTFPSADGTEVEGFIYLPPDYQEGKRYPTLLRIHGGPVSQFRHSFNFEAQLFAANGYVVVTVNPRGSSGYGQAFSHAIWADWGNKDLEDVLAGVDYAVERGWADPDRLGVGGWSYGGILTNYAITKSDRFRAAITGASEVLYIANYGHDHYQRQWEAELGLPWESRERWERISPFNDVDRVTTPTLIMGGEDDWNVPIQNSEQLYQALRRRGVPTQLIVYPGQSHGLRAPKYQRDRLERYLSWYDRWLGSVTGVSEP